MGNRERTVQEEPGDQEEDRHADLQAAGVGPERRSRRVARDKCCVEQQDRNCGNGTKSVESCKVTWLDTLRSNPDPVNVGMPSDRVLIECRRIHLLTQFSSP